MNKTKKLTFCAIICALSLAIFFLASALTTGTLTFQYVAGLLIMLAVAKSGIKFGILSYFVICISGWIIIPDKTIIISYIIFFGSIPLIKYFAEKKGRIFEWIIKLVCFNIFVLGIYFAYQTTLTYSQIIIWLAFLAAALLYDVLLSFGFTFASKYLKKP